MRLIYVNMQHDYVDMQHKYVNIRGYYVNMRLNLDACQDKYIAW